MYFDYFFVEERLLFLCRKYIIFVCFINTRTRKRQYRNMKKFALTATVLFCAMSFASFAQMTDDQVIEYVKSGLSSGKSQNQISTELIARGVTQAQVERIKAQIEQTKGSETSITEQAFAPGFVLRDSRTEALSAGDGTSDAVAAETAAATSGEGIQIYGHDFFSGRTLTFEPNENAATPQDYRLGPGDQLVIEIWGYSEGSYRQTISPEGRIYISQIGPIQLSGLTIKAASEKIRKALVSKYASIGGSNPNTSVSVTLGEIRTIQVNVMGEVRTAGTYRLSSFSTVFHALYRAGGVTDRGSLRAIKVIRAGEQIASVDVYDYLMEGKTDTDIALQEGDVIIVPPYVNIVTISGNVKRPMSYEMLGGETLSTLLEYAGGFTSDAYKDDFRLIRQSGVERQVFNVRHAQIGNFMLDDGDQVTVGANLDRFSNKVEVRGYVFRPGMFELGKEIATVRQLIEAAGGLKEDAFSGRAVLMREKDDLSLETISFDLAGVLSGKAEDILLRKNDIVSISGIYELQDRGTLTINGYVANPGVFMYSDNTTVEDLILLAGGLLDGASTARVDVARRVVDPASMQPLDEIGETFSFPLKDGLVADGGERFTLKPYDVVSVRKSPAFRTQSFVRVEGEVAFPGEYVLLTEGERASDVIRRAGGPTKQAFVRGGTLTRTMSEEEANVQNSIRAITQNTTTRDTLNVSLMRKGDKFSVGIELDRAISNPGSEFDPILREGDRIFVPELQNTVRISGNVLFPNTVTYVPGKSLGYYVSAAGGYGLRAKRSKTYIVYQNGNVRRASSGDAKIEPGCEIIVPERPERRNVSAGEVISLGSSAASMAMVVVALINAINK